jgi:hypothetical protein
MLRLKSFAVRWCQPQAVLHTKSGYRRRKARYVRPKVASTGKFSHSGAQFAQAYSRREPYGQHPVSVSDKIRLLLARLILRRPLRPFPPDDAT